MKNILCHSVFDIFTMFDVLHQLELDLKSQVCIDMSQYYYFLIIAVLRCVIFLHKNFQLLNGPRRIRLLIIDSISSLITPILGGSGLQGIHS